MSASLERIIAVLERVAPLEYAADWDNVGLLLEPLVEREVRRALLTIDLTPGVLEEARRRGVELVVAYHPPIFTGLKRLTRRDPRQRLLLGLIDAGLAVYSPHTALDAIVGGVNDWLLEACPASEARPIVLVPDAPGNIGQGRLARLTPPLALDAAVAAIKAHLGLARVRVARAVGREAPVESIALCAGAGASVLQGCEADLWLTGEMRHHDVLAAVASGTHVVLTDHTNTERGFLPRLAERLHCEDGEAIEWLVSEVDEDPLAIV